MADTEETWFEPVLDWNAALERSAVQEQFAQGERLVTWPAQPFEATPTDCFTTDGQYWIWQVGVGAVRFTPESPRLSAFPDPAADLSWFHQVVIRSWLPAIYPFWGRQVIHASAVFAEATGDVVAFAGSSQAGKSTTAYGVSRRPGWRLLSDDTLAFSVGPDGTAALHPLKNDARLRPQSADYFGKGGDPPAAVPWPEQPLHLRAFYSLEGDDRAEAVAEFTRLPIAEGLPLLLRQAYALSFELPKYNQQLMRDYAQLAASTPMYRLRYRRSFAVAGTLFEAIEQHCASSCRVRF